MFSLDPIVIGFCILTLLVFLFALRALTPQKKITPYSENPIAVIRKTREFKEAKIKTLYIPKYSKITDPKIQTFKNRIEIEAIAGNGFVGNPKYVFGYAKSYTGTLFKMQFRREGNRRALRCAYSVNLLWVVENPDHEHYEWELSNSHALELNQPN